MGCAHFDSSDPWTRSNTVSQEHGGGIQEAWTEIKNHGGGRECFAGENRKKLEKRKSQVLLEGYVEAPELDDDDLSRAKSLTDDDLEELKGCLDLGFGFSYNKIPELCNTLPALELCYSMSQKFIDEKQKSPEISPVEEDSPSPPPPTTTTTTTTSPVASWKISSPGDNPDDVKARLKYWAQAVACTVRLCS